MILIGAWQQECIKFADSDISATSASSDSDTAQDTTDRFSNIAPRNKSTTNVDEISLTQTEENTSERISATDEDAAGNRSWRQHTLKRRSDETKYSDEWSMLSPAKRIRLGSVSKSITCAKLIKKAKKIKLASMFKKASRTVLINETEMPHKTRATDDNANRRRSEETHIVNRQTEVDVIETLPINYSLPDHAAEINVVNGEMPIRKSSLNHIFRYLLNKELEETRQSVNCEQLKLAEHLRQTLAYFDEKLKYNDGFGIGISDVQNLVTLKMEEEDICKNRSSSLVAQEPEPRPAHQRPDVSTFDFSQHGGKQQSGELPRCTGAPLPAHQPSIVEKHVDGPLPAHQTPKNNHLPQRTSSRKVLPLFRPI